MFAVLMLVLFSYVISFCKDQLSLAIGPFTEGTASGTAFDLKSAADLGLSLNNSVIDVNNVNSLQSSGTLDTTAAGAATPAEPATGTVTAP